MSQEAPQWTHLTPAQAWVLNVEIAASGEMQFGAAASELGVGLLNGLKRPVAIGEGYDNYWMAGWVDHFEHGVVDAIVVSRELVNAKDREDERERALRLTSPMAYARVRPTGRNLLQPEAQPGVYDIEGVALNLPTSYKPVSYHGRLELPQAVSPEEGRLYAAACFLAEALEHAARPPELDLRTMGRPMLGVDHLTSRRVFLGLSTLRQHVLIGNQLVEPHYMAGRAYKVAAGLLSVVLDQYRKEGFTSSMGCRNSSGDLHGVVFTTPEADMVAVRQVATRPETLLLTTARKPQNNSPAAVQQYFIQERGVFTLVGELQPHDFTLQGLHTMLPNLDEGNQHALDSRINLSDDAVDFLIDMMAGIMKSQSMYALRGQQ